MKQHVLTRGIKLAPNTIVDGESRSNALTYFGTGLTVQEIKRTGTKKKGFRILVTLENKSWAWVCREDLEGA